MRKLRLHLLCSAFALFGSVLCGTMALAQEPVRIVFMDPLSGPFASIGTSGLKQIQFAADY